MDCAITWSQPSSNRYSFLDVYIYHNKTVVTTSTGETPINPLVPAMAPAALVLVPTLRRGVSTP